MTKAEFLAAEAAAWQALQAFIATLSPEQMTLPTDAAGWTVKDHLMHLAVWQAGVTAMLHFQPRYETMGLARALAESGDFDAMNAVIHTLHRTKSLEEVLKTLQSVHAHFLETVSALTDADLAQPYSYYQPHDDRSGPVLGWLIADSFEHYAEHIPWMQAIAG